MDSTVDPELLVNAAKRKVQKTPWYSSFFGPSQEERLVQASDLYAQAAHRYKYAQEWDKAGQCYLDAYRYSVNSISLLVDAVKCLRKINTTAVLPMLEEIVLNYRNQGNFSQAAKYQKQIAEIKYSQHMYKEALQDYKLARDIYLGEDSFIQAKACLIQMADMSARDTHEYEKAAKYYEQVVQLCVQRNMFLFTQDYLLKAGICRLQCMKNDLVGLRKKLEEYAAVDNFGTKPEGKFLGKLLWAMESGDTFTMISSDYKRLDAWVVDLLERLQQEELDFT